MHHALGAAQLLYSPPSKDAIHAGLSCPHAPRITRIILQFNNVLVRDELRKKSGDNDELESKNSNQYTVGTHWRYSSDAKTL